MKQFFVLTLFPEMIEQTLSHSIMGRAQKEGHISVEAVNIRDFTLNKHKHVDDYPYGGGAGLVMQGQPIYDAYQSLLPKAEHARVVFMTPQGDPLRSAWQRSWRRRKIWFFFADIMRALMNA